MSFSKQNKTKQVLSLFIYLFTDYATEVLRLLLRDWDPTLSKLSVTFRHWTKRLNSLLQLSSHLSHQQRAKRGIVIQIIDKTMYL